jgi:hypothetical protein
MINNTIVDNMGDGVTITNPHDTVMHLVNNIVATISVYPLASQTAHRIKGIHHIRAVRQTKSSIRRGLCKNSFDLLQRHRSRILHVSTHIGVFLAEVAIRQDAVGIIPCATGFATRTNSFTSTLGVSSRHNALEACQL